MILWMSAGWMCALGPSSYVWEIQSGLDVFQRMVDNNGIPRGMKAVLEGYAINCNQILSNRVKNSNIYHATYLLCIIHYILAIVLPQASQWKATIMIIIHHAAVHHSFQAFLLCMARVTTKWVQIHLLRMIIVARLHTVTQFRHLVSLPYTVLTESAMGLKSCKDVNHRKSPLISSLQDFILHLKWSSMTMLASCIRTARIINLDFHWRGHVSCSSDY